MRNLAILIGLATSLPGLALAQSCPSNTTQVTEVNLLNGRRVVRCDTPLDRAHARARARDPWKKAQATARARDPWKKAQATARARDPWARAQARARACDTLGSAQRRARARLARLPVRETDTRQPRAHVDPWAEAPATDLPRAIPVPAQTTGRQARCEPVDTGRRSSPPHATPTGRTAIEARPIGYTGRSVRPDQDTSTGRSPGPRGSSPQGLAYALVEALQSQDWDAICRLGRHLASSGAHLRAQVQDQFFALYPSPTLIQQAHDGLRRHCQDRASVLSLLDVLGDRPAPALGH